MIVFAVPKLLFTQFRILHWESYVPLVELSKYQHMWSFFGRSHNYNLFIGSIEVLIGVLIVFKRTRLIALLIALGIFTNILILNIEFDIYFAIAHIFQDWLIVIFLLSNYYGDLYKFFVTLGGKFNHSIKFEKNRFKRYFPYVFLLTILISDLTIVFNTKPTVNEKVVGAYKIESIKVNESVLDIDKGDIGKFPMMFIEHNHQFVLSINDTVYFGNYRLNKDSIKIYINYPKMRSLDGLIKDSSLVGKTIDNQFIHLNYKRIDGKKNYLNDLYYEN